jgi:hypothetical protein
VHRQRPVQPTPRLRLVDPSLLIFAADSRSLCFRPRHDAVLSPRHDAVLSPRHDAVLSPRHDAVLSPRHDAVLSPRYDAVLSPRHDAVLSPRPPSPRSPSSSPPPPPFPSSLYPFCSLTPSMALQLPQVLNLQLMRFVFDIKSGVCVCV